MANIVRHLVSKKKRRFEWGEFDLDLTYITDRIVAMGFPSEHIEGLYRNKMRDVQKFFESLHAGHYRIYNLCSERKYDFAKFAGEVAEFPFDDHGPPPLAMIKAFCLDVEQWLDADPFNVIGVHCKAGKGRTGTMISCWLMYSGYCKTSNEACRLFANKRTMNGKGITIPSQFRYVKYWEHILNNAPPSHPRSLIMPDTSTVVLTNIVMHGVPNFNIGGGCEPFIGICQRNKHVYYSRPLKIKKGTEIVEFECGDIILSRDVKIQFFNKSSKGQMFTLSFHTAYVAANYIKFRRQELDRVNKDSAYKHFGPGFQVELYFNKLQQPPTLINRAEQTASSYISSISQANTIFTCGFCSQPINPELVPHKHMMKDMMKAGRNILLVCLLLCCIDISTAQDTTCDFKCWFTSLTVPLSSFSIINSQNTTLTLSDISCSHNNITSIESSLPSSSSLYLSFNNLSTLCTSTWKIDDDNSTGNVSIELLSPQFTTTISLYKQDDSAYSNNASLSSCSPPSPAVVNITFNSTDPRFSSFLPLINSSFPTDLSSGFCQAMEQAIIDNTIIPALNQADEMLEGLVTPIPPWTSINGTGMVTLNGTVMEAVQWALANLVGATGPIGLNNVMNSITNGTGLVVVADIPALMSHLPISVPTFYTTSMEDVGIVNISLLAMNISGLNQWNDVVVLNPIDQYTLLTHTEISHLSLSLLVDVSLLTFDQTQTYTDKSIITLNMAENDLTLVLSLLFNQSVYSQYATNQLFDWKCWVAILEGAVIQELDLNFTIHNYTYLPTSSSSSSPLLHDVMDLVIDSFYPAVPVVINTVIQSLVQLGNGGVGIALPILRSKFICPAPQSIVFPPSFNVHTARIIFPAFSGFFVMVVLAVFILQRRRRSTSYYDHESTYLKQHQYQHHGKKNNFHADDEYQALIVHRRLAWWVRLSIPLALLATAALFVSSNTSIGASVYPITYVDGHVQTFESLYDFSLVNTIRDMWHAKVYPLSILICVFSGVWPYVKLLMMFFCWVTPTSDKLMTPLMRERILIFLDALGKWSLLDTFVLIMMVVAFHFQISAPTSTGELAKDAWVGAFVVPHYGFFSFAIATMVSLVLSHLIVRCHRVATEEYTAPNSSEKQALYKQSYQKWMVPAIIILTLASLVMVIVGSIIYTFNFEFKGAFGYLLTLIEQPSSSSYSVFSLGRAIPKSSLSPHSSGIIFIQISFYIFAIVMPIIYLSVLFLLWVVPLSFKAQRRMMVVMEVTQAWSALEVFVVAVIASLLEIRQFAQFMVGDRCDLVNKIIAKYGTNIIPGGDYRCFDVVATLQEGCWTLFAAAACYLIAGIVVAKVCHRSLRRRLHEFQAIN
eukprot:TRINITY_DN2268_c0_g1_i1.p1 TRINITY_DN2268_c0_g1~~TRINITY_DN2268_c0_g1_i1.p1  ORF type:complete len:1347 (-),score=287.19 TRINITY_DN2268_c0_g1_i1:129-4169(-)